MLPATIKSKAMVGIEVSLCLSQLRARPYCCCIDKLINAIVGIDFPNEDKLKSNRRVERMLLAAAVPLAQGDAVFSVSQPDLQRG